MKKHYKQPKLLAKARAKYPCFSTALILLIFSCLWLGGESIAAKIPHHSNPENTSSSTTQVSNNNNL